MSGGSPGRAPTDPADAWYAYGVVPSPGRAPDCPAIVPEGRIEAVPIGALAVLASRVRRGLFDRDDATNRTADPDWMGARVAAYHAVSAAAAAAGPFLPMAFGTVFSTLDRLDAWVAPRETALEAALARVAGLSEWRLSLEADRNVQAAWLEDRDPAVRNLAVAVAGATEGTAFLMSRRLDKARETARARHIAASTDKVASALAQMGLTQPGLDQTGLTVLPAAPTAGLPSWTVLAPRGAPDMRRGWPALLDLVAAELAPSGLSLRLTGPWPPYSFARTALAATKNEEEDDA